MYPLKFQPVFQKRLWGGSRLRDLLKKPVGADLARETVGESWELADLPPHTVKADSTGAAADGSLSSVISNGRYAGKTLHALLADADIKTQIMGQAPLKEGCFPLLIKFLDAQQDLSVQVHPDEAYARTHPGAHLKSEAWYILHAEPGARIYKGLRKGVTREVFQAALKGGFVEPLLNDVPVRAGDCHFLPSGTLHALGAGILAAEVQTPSDTTFRVFDWNRLGSDGKPRTLHVEEGLACIRFEPAESPPPVHQRHSDSTRLVECPYFILDRVELSRGQTCSIRDDAPRVVIMLEGQGVIHAGEPTAVIRGETVLMPAALKAAVTAIAPLTWLEVRLP